MNFYKFCRNARIQCNAFHSPRSFETPISPQNKGGERDVWPPDDPIAATCCVAVGGNPSLTSLSASAFSSKHSPQQLKYRIKFYNNNYINNQSKLQGKGKGEGEGEGEKQLRKVNVGGGG